MPRLHFNPTVHVAHQDCWDLVVATGNTTRYLSYDAAGTQSVTPPQLLAPPDAVVAFPDDKLVNISLSTLFKAATARVHTEV